jgi:hypothetical protein
MLYFLVCWFLSFLLRVAILVVSCSGSVGSYDVCAATWCSLPTMFWILGYAYRCLCRSCVTYFNWFCIIWYISNEFKCFNILFPFTSIMSIICVMNPYVCPLFTKWLANPELDVLWTNPYNLWSKKNEHSANLDWIHWKTTHHKIRFGKETTHSINFLDLSIHRKEKRVRLCNIQQTHSDRYHDTLRLLPATITKYQVSATW